MEERIVLKGEQFFERDCPIYINYSRESFRQQKHAHDFFEIAYVSEGAGIHYIADAAVPTGKGDLFLIPIGVSHIFRPNDDVRPLKVINCVFPRELMQMPISPFYPGLSDDFERFMAFFRTLSTWRAFREKSTEFYKTFHTLYFTFASRLPGYRYKLYHQVLGLLENLYRAASPQPASLDEFSGHPLFPALCRMSERYMEPLTVSELSAVVNMSPRHFQRCFKRLTGRSFSQMLQHIRLERSESLLIDTDMSVQAIARHVGIADLKHFYHLFHQKYGVTPAVFRKRLGKADL